jgi:glutaredoxin
LRKKAGSDDLDDAFMSVVVYTKVADPYSVRACTLLRMKGVTFVEKEVAAPGVVDEMLRVTGSSSTPQIVIHGTVVGGFEELGSLELKGELDRLLHSTHHERN